MSDVPAITVQDLHKMIQDKKDIYILDVREGWENELCCLPNNQNIPLGKLVECFDEIPQDKVIIAHCHHGGRSAKATEILRAKGFDKVFNLTGGIHEWALKVDSSVKTYQ